MRFRVGLSQIVGHSGDLASSPSLRSSYAGATLHPDNSGWLAGPSATSSCRRTFLRGLRLHITTVSLSHRDKTRP
jgi:hypothetical protein